MKKKHLIFLIIIILSGFLIFSIYKYFEIKPFINNLFKNADNLVYNQKLTDSVIILIDQDNNEIELSLKDSVNLSFFSFKNFELEYKFDERFYNIETDLNADLKKIKKTKKINSALYKCDTVGLPFKYKKIDLPYKIRIYNNEIIESKIYN